MNYQYNMRLQTLNTYHPDFMQEPKNQSIIGCPYNLDELFDSQPFLEHPLFTLPGEDEAPRMTGAQRAAGSKVPTSDRIKEDNKSPLASGMMTQRAAGDSGLDPYTFLFETVLNTDWLIESQNSQYTALADHVMEVKRKRDKKKKSEPHAPKEEKPFTKRLKAKKSLFQTFYKGVKQGGQYRHLIAVGEGHLSEDNIKLLDEELALHLCLTTNLNDKDAEGKTEMGPDGKPKKINAKK
jgi:hypothetical protein